IAARMTLEGDPGAAIVGGYVMTRGAELAWEAINRQLTMSRGAFFWIGGGAGTGKTHFLNYTVTLSNRAAAAGSASGRHLTLAVDASERASAGELDRQVLEQLALQLAGDSRGATLWRQLRGGEGLTVALDQARRQGVKGLIAVIDLGTCGLLSAHAQLEAIAAVARDFKHLRLIV